MTHDEMIAVIQALKDGKVIQFRTTLGILWRDWDRGGYLDFIAYVYRIKPTPKRVPLGPDDFPPGTAISSSKSGTEYAMLTAVNCDEISAGSAEWTYSELAGHYHFIRRRLPGSTEWLPCWREE